MANLGTMKEYGEAALRRRGFEPCVISEVMEMGTDDKLVEALMTLARFKYAMDGTSARYAPSVKSKFVVALECLAQKVEGRR